jgi:hypothetical protein
MNDEQVQLPVVLTRKEASDVEVKASEEGVSTPDFLSYCVRLVSFGIGYAVKSLPAQGQNGPDRETEK